jgi:hypothetical protein
MTRSTRYLWIAALCLYAVGAVGDAALHFREEHETGLARFAPDRAVVAFAAGLFWPVDVVAQLLLPEG